VGYLERCLIPGEEVRYRASLHWSVILRTILAGILLDLAGIACFLWWALSPRAEGSASGPGVLPFVGAVFLVLGGLVLAVGLIRRASTEIVVTSRRVLIKTGILERRTVELLLSKIESVDVTETVSGRMLGFGRVVLRGTGGTPEVFERIANPLEFRRQIQSQVDALPGREKISSS
jgi:uncharacterized membrane protein YdbT with pleckstrin-like domain